MVWGGLRMEVDARVLSPGSKLPEAVEGDLLKMGPARFEIELGVACLGLGFVL